MQLSRISFSVLLKTMIDKQTPKICEYSLFVNTRAFLPTRTCYEKLG